MALMHWTPPNIILNNEFAALAMRGERGQFLKTADTATLPVTGIARRHAGKTAGDLQQEKTNS